MILNSLALKKANITRNIPQPKAGGWFFKDKNGELNGREQTIVGGKAIYSGRKAPGATAQR